MKLDKSFELVETALKEKPETREDDKLLMLLIWQWQGLKLTKEQIAFFRHSCLNPETITRCRRMFHQRGMYKPVLPKDLFV